MVAHNGQPKIKFSSDPEKTTNPGLKEIIRIYNQDGFMDADVLADASEDLRTGETIIVDLNDPLHREKLDSDRREELLVPIVESGRIVYTFPSLDQIRSHRELQLSRLHEEHKRLQNPNEYKVALTERLWLQKEKLSKQIRS